MFILSSQNHFLSLYFPSNFSLHLNLTFFLYFCGIFFPAIIFLICLLILTETILFQQSLSFSCSTCQLNYSCVPMEMLLFYALSRQNPKRHGKKRCVMVLYNIFYLGRSQKRQKTLICTHIHTNQSFSTFSCVPVFTS